MANFVENAGRPGEWTNMTQRERLCNAREHLSRVDALLSAWIDDWKREGEGDPTHDRIVLARQSIRDALGWLEETSLEDGRDDSHEEPPTVAWTWRSWECVAR